MAIFFFIDESRNKRGWARQMKFQKRKKKKKKRSGEKRSLIRSKKKKGN